MTATERSSIPLESGDRLSRDEFHRRYCARPEIRRAELIEGVVYVASPVGLRHAGPHGLTAVWLGSYMARTPGLQIAIDATIFLEGDNEVQPDVCLFRLNPPGRAQVFADEHDTEYIRGAPELVMEVAASSASYDLHDKKAVYERSGILEYVVWQVLENRIAWFRLIDGQYVLVEPSRDGIIESAVFPGLRLDVERMVAGDVAGVLAAVQSPHTS